MMHPHRMRAFLGKPCVVDDPGFDRTALRHRRHDLFTHLGQHPLIRPRGFGDNVQQLLMLHRNVSRSRHRRHRLHAAPARCCQQTSAIIPKRSLPIRMPNHLRHFIDIRRKPIRMLQFAPKTHPSLPLIGSSTTS
jgi:hypothetical protein